MENEFQTLVVELLSRKLKKYDFNQLTDRIIEILTQEAVTEAMFSLSTRSI